MAQAVSWKVTGLRELIRAADASDKRTKRYVRAELRKVGEIVRPVATSLFSPIDSGSASTFGVSVRRVGTVSVEQRRRKTTGRRGDYGALQMRRGLLPALQQTTGQIYQAFEETADRLAHEF